MIVVSFVAASSNSGKTTLIEKLVRLFKLRGLRVAVVKHASQGFELDKPGKDSWRFQQAGADEVVLVGPGALAHLKKTGTEPSFEEVERMMADIDILICEGRKKFAKNMIEVFRQGVSGNRPLCLDDARYLALVSDQLIEVGIPRFDLNDANAIAAFVMAMPQGK